MQATIIKKEIDRNGGVHTLSFKLAAGQCLADFDLEQVGGSILGTGCERGTAFVVSTETNLEVGDSITDQFGGCPIIAETHGQSESITIKNAFGTIVDHRDAFAQKRSGEGER